MLDAEPGRALLLLDDAAPYEADPGRVVGSGSTGALALRRACMLTAAGGTSKRPYDRHGWMKSGLLLTMAAFLPAGAVVGRRGGERRSALPFNISSAVHPAMKV